MHVRYFFRNCLDVYSLNCSECCGFLGPLEREKKCTVTRGVRRKWVRKLSNTNEIYRKKKRKKLIIRSRSTRKSCTGHVFPHFFFFSDCLPPILSLYIIPNHLWRSLFEFLFPNSCPFLSIPTDRS